MAEVVDAIIADLIVRGVDQYERNFERATNAHGRFTKSVDKLKTQTFDLNAEGQKYKQGTNAIGQADEQLTQRVARSRKARADASVAADEKEVASAKRSAKAKADAEIAEAERSARYRAIAERAAERQRTGLSSGRPTRIGASVPREPTGQASIPASVLAGGAGAAVAEEKQINALKVEQIQLEDSLNYLTGARKAQVAELLAEMRLSNRLEAEGVAESEIALRLEQRRVAVAAERAAAQKVAGRTGGFGGANEFALQASGGRFGYSFGAGAIAGAGVVAGAAALAATKAAITAAAEYANALQRVSKEAGITAEALQVYHRAAEDNGAETKDFDTAISSLTDTLAKARSGSKDAQKVFDALGVSIKGTDTAGQLLPTLIDRLSKVEDQSLRSAAELALFGQAGQKLDSMLAGGNAKINELAKGLEETGKILSSSDIAQLESVHNKLQQVNSDLKESVSQQVAQNSAAIINLANAYETLADRAIKAAGAVASATLTMFRSGGTLSSTGLGITDRIFGRGNQQRAATDPLGTTNKSGELLAMLDAARVQTGSPNLAALRSLNAPAGRHPRGKSAETLEREAERRQKFVTDTLARFDDEILSARQQLTADEGEKAALSREQLDGERRRALADVITNAQLQKLKTQQVDQLRKALADTSEGSNDRLDDLINGLKGGDFKELLQRAQRSFRARENVINYQENARDTEDAIALQRQQLDLEREILQSRVGIARTADERRKLELAILANTEAQEKATDAPILEEGRDRDAGKAINRHYSDRQIAEARARAGTFDQRHDMAVQGINQQDAGPWADYVNKLPSTAKQIKEEFEQAAVSGVERLNDSLGDSISKMLHLHGAAGEFLNDLIKIGLHAIEADIFGSGASGGQGGSGGGFLKTAVTAIGSLFGGHRAGGGGVQAGKVYEVGERGRELFAPGVSGTIIPNHMINAVSPNQRVIAASRAPTLIQQTVHVDARNSVNPDGFENRILAKSAQVAVELDRHSARQTLEATPGYVSRQQTLKG